MSVRFHWTETQERMEELLALEELLVAEHRRSFTAASGIEFEPPLVQPIGAELRSAREYLAGLRPYLGRELVLLIQAGASAMGLWEDDEFLAHKVVKKYVVRGKGRAQPLHLKTRGKSRYGSRLRLQNARRQLEETSAKLREWWEEFGPCERIFTSCPVRTWPELFELEPRPPFEQRDGRLVRIPLHVHPPSFAELERVRRLLTHGRIREPGEGC